MWGAKLSAFQSPASGGRAASSSALAAVFIRCSETAILCYEEAGLLHWRIRGHVEEERDAPTNSQHQCRTQEWSHLGPSGPDHCPANHIVEPRQKQQRSPQANPQTHETNKLLSKQLHFRVVCCSAVNNLYHWVLNEMKIYAPGKVDIINWKKKSGSKLYAQCNLIEIKHTYIQTHKKM